MTDTPAELYDRDFFAWTQEQARALRRFTATHPNLPLDLPHLAEEIADLGKEQRNGLRSWTTQIMLHLLLLEHSPAQEPRVGWENEVCRCRLDIDARLTPTLRRDLVAQLPTLYEKARTLAASKLDRHGERAAATRLPVPCPYLIDQILNDWWPASGS
jgi:hypothetical protein